MEQYVKAISLRAEFSIVVLIAFGYFIVGSLLSIINPSPNAPISEVHLRSLLIYESVVMLTLWKFLSLRGWKLRQVGLVPAVRETIIGLGLAIVAYVTYAVIWAVSSRLVPGLEEQAGSLVAPSLSLVTVLIVSVLNPVFEELFVCGYVIAVLKKSRSISFAVNVSVGIRLAYHLYQGAVGVVSIIPLGFIFAYWFAKTGRLWPVVVAHGIFDFLGLVAYARM